MRYMLIMCDDDRTDDVGPAEIATSPEFAGWLRHVEERGVPHTGLRLRPAAEAVTVRVRDGRTLVTDGPFADTKEQIGGYEIVECPDLDVAIDVASAHPSARVGVEIRPFWEG
jgi:hypothetical protein